MKRIIAIILACSLLLSGCASSTPSTQAPSSEAPSSNQTEIEQTTNDTSEASTEAKTPEESTAASESSGESTVAPEADWDIHAPSPSKNIPVAPTYTGLNDPNLLSDFENAVYFFRPPLLLCFLPFNNRFRTDFFNIAISHIG
jgi:uncharacterized protein YceK